MKGRLKVSDGLFIYVEQLIFRYADGMFNVF